MFHRAKKDKNYTVVSNYYIRDMRLSTKAVGMLTKMLSLPDNWNFSIRGLSAICKESHETIREMVIELEKAGYVVRRQRRGKSGKWKPIEYEIYEIPLLVEAEEETLKASATETPSPRETPAPRPKALELDAETLNQYRQEIRQNINFEKLWRERGEDIREVAEIVEILAEACAGTEPVRVRGQNIDAKRARERYLSLEEDHILYVMESMRNTHTEIKNIRAYMLAALYNAPTTIDQYYKTLAQREEESEEGTDYQGYQSDYED